MNLVSLIIVKMEAPNIRLHTERLDLFDEFQSFRVFEGFV
jgi:hypothetical protein